jgi:hypothetical protein
MLYAQVVQADASTRGAVQIDLRRLSIMRTHQPRSVATLAVEGDVRWSGAEVRAALELAGLPGDSPLSALTIEVLPEANGSFDDPLGGDLGQVRILRTSPLSAVARDCCTA